MDGTVYGRDTCTDLTMSDATWIDKYQLKLDFLVFNRVNQPFKVIRKRQRLEELYTEEHTATLTCISISSQGDCFHFVYFCYCFGLSQVNDALCLVLHMLMDSVHWYIILAVKASMDSDQTWKTMSDNPTMPSKPRFGSLHTCVKPDRRVFCKRSSLVLNSEPIWEAPRAPKSWDAFWSFKTGCWYGTWNLE